MSAAATRLLLLTLAFLSLWVLTADGAPLEAPPADGGVLKLDNKSNGQPSSALVGQAIQVKLEDDTTDPGFTLTYSDVKSSDETVVAPNKPGEEEPPKDNMVNFKAARGGTSDITATVMCVEADEAADPKKCPESVPEWKVTVDVHDAAPTP